MSEIQSSFKRYEKKYLLTKEQYQKMRGGMAAYMEPDKNPSYSILNIYCDTEHYDLIRTSLDKPVYKEKLRIRSYGVPAGKDTVFIEIKKKFEGVVYKRRIPIKMQDTDRFMHGIRKGESSQISREIEYFLQLYRPEPKVLIAYDRTAFASADGSDLRITFDTALRARSVDLDLRHGDYGLPIMDDRILMEIKIPGAAPMWLARLLSENKIFSTSFSKYGTYYQQFVLGGRSAALKKEVVLSA